MKISIISAVFNNVLHIGSCLESVSSQTWPDIEHIIIDGGSTDGTLEIIKAGKRSEAIGNRQGPITRLMSEPDNGIYDGLNKGIRLATGDVIGFLHSDDVYAHDRVFEKVMKVMSQKDCDSCYGDLLYVKEGPQDSRLTSQQAGKRASGQACGLDGHSRFTVVRRWRSGNYTERSFYWGWMPPHPTFFVRRPVYEKYGLFNLGLGSAADYELMLRFLLKHRIKAAYVPEVLVKMRTGGVSNASLSNRLRANRMDRKAWEVNGLRPYPWTLYMKPLRKLPQFLIRGG